MSSGNRVEQILVNDLRFVTLTDTLAGNTTLVTGSPSVQMLDPGGASRDVTLPAEADSEGRIFILINTADAAENLVVKNDGAATVATIAQNEGGILVCDGTSWKGIVGANT